jgi:hypothetical protein
MNGVVRFYDGFYLLCQWKGRCNPTFCTLYATDFYPSFIWPTRLLVNLHVYKITNELQSNNIIDN